MKKNIITIVVIVFLIWANWDSVFPSKSTGNQQGPDSVLVQEDASPGTNNEAESQQTDNNSDQQTNANSSEWITCPLCNGSGVYWNDVCSKCGGSGHISAAQFRQEVNEMMQSSGNSGNSSSSAKQEVKCAACNGTGKCWACNGKGWKTYEVSYGNYQNLDCSECHGTGRCQTCGGTGKP